MTTDRHMQVAAELLEAAQKRAEAAESKVAQLEASKDTQQFEIFQLQKRVKSLEAQVQQQTQRAKEHGDLYAAEMRANSSMFVECRVMKTKLETITRQRHDVIEALKYLLGQCENFDSVSSISEVRSAMRCAKAAIANAGGWPITIDGEVPNE